jgi:hypothetical protein
MIDISLRELCLPLLDKGPTSNIDKLKKIKMDANHIPRMPLPNQCILKEGLLSPFGQTSCQHFSNPKLTKDLDWKKTEPWIASQYRSYEKER